MPLKVILTGTYRQPELRFPFGWGEFMPRGSVTAQEWVKKLGSRYFNREEKTWYITGVGTAKSPDRFFADAGLEVDFSEATGELAGLTSLNDLWRPLVQRSSRFPHQAFVRPRLAGFQDIQERLGPGAVWDKNLKRFEVLLSDMVTTGPDGLAIKRGFLLDAESFEAAVQARRESSIPAAVREAARELGASTGVEGDFQDELSPRTRELIDIVASHTGRLPEWFGLALYPFQTAGAYAIVGGHNALCDAPGLGKCVVPETNVLANGAYTAIGQLWDEHAAVSAPRPDYDGIGEIIELAPGQLTVQALDENVTTARTVSASHLYRERITAPVKTIRTASGAKITATLPHKFLTSRGWTNEILAGDMVAVPDNTPFVETHPETSMELARLMAWQIGEGYEHKAPRVEITNNDTDRLESLAADLKVVSKQTGVTIPGDLSTRHPVGKSPVLVFAATAWRKWLQDNGYAFGQLAAGKSVPPFILGARPDVQREFLSNYFSAEGSFSTKNGVLEIASASRLLMLQLQAMLSRFGVAMNLADRQKCATNGTRIMRTYTVGVITGEDIITFRDTVGFADSAKQSRLDSYKASSTSNITRRIPCIEMVKEISAAGISARSFARTGSFTGAAARGGVTRTAALDALVTLHGISDGSMRHRYESETPHRWTRKVLAGLDAFTPASADAAIERMNALLSPSVRWTKVTSVEISDYEGWVYDLTVPEGHNYIAEGLWSHNTRQALAAAAISGADRVVIVVPPLVVTNFSREATAALGPKFAAMMPPAEPEPAPKTKSRAKKPKKAPEFPPYITPIRAGRKVPPFPEAGVIVVADSLLASRPELLDDIIAWGPQCALFDEAHRASTWSGKRATADRNLSLSVNGLSVPMTGTPFKANPVEVTNILALSGHLAPVFGGASEFIERYATKDRFGGWMPKRKMLPDLERQLTAHCWVRRNKQDVLKQLPPKLRTTRVVDIDRRGFAQAHEALYEKIGLWVDEMLENGVEITQEDIKVYAKTHIEIITPLRAAAGVAKIPAAIEIVKDWLEATTEKGPDGSKVYTRPLVVWVHHNPVMEALKAAIPADMAGIGFIDGSTPEHKRQPEADKLQNGEIGVIFCSIMAAGFGITLTRSSDVIFIETDWTPANISQAEDRVHRIGQTETCMITTLLAVDTLDAHMRAILRNKGKDLNVLMPGADNNVTVMTAHLNEEAGQYEILTQEDRELEKEFKSVPEIIERIVTEIVRQRTALARAA